MAARVDVKAIFRDMDRYIQFMESTRKKKPERILLTKQQYEAVRAKLNLPPGAAGGTRYRDVPLEIA